MLKINKILSKKIKSPLSLRGAKRRSNLSGFSLIELMVAVAILAMAIFGIFHAYSAGFMGMADARDRTVATNYAREAMEDIKNKDFDQIITQSRNYINGTKYEREVIVQKSTNLKKVTTKVYWKDRNGTWKTVETDMVIHFIETTAGTPTKIILFAEPYNVLTENITDPGNIIDETKSIITAVVKDAKGNTVTAGSINISFSITTGSDLGIISPESEISIEGKATTIFTASSKGEVIITASANGLTDNSVTIKITDHNTPVKINLTASPIFMTPSSESLITAVIVNAGGATVTEDINQVEITFSVSGPGDLSTPTNIQTALGIATITLVSNGTAGTITVIASSTDLEPGIINVYTGGWIYLSASPINVPVNETSEITVTTKDMNGVPMKYIGTIDLSVAGDGGNPGFGTLPSYSVNFNGESSSETILFTASNVGDVQITSEDSSEQAILTPENYLILTVIPELNPDHIKVNADPPNIPIKIGGDTPYTTITAQVEDKYYTPITSYTETIYFKTDLGEFLNGSKEINTTDDAAYINKYENGEATVDLYSSADPGTANISVTSVYYGETISGNTRVGFYSEADHIDLIAIPQSILTGGGSEGTCTIIATIKDGATVVSGYDGAVTFTIVEGYPNGVKFISTNQSSISIDAVGGVATMSLQSKNWVGDAKIKVSASEGLPTLLESEILIPVVANKNLEIFMLYRKIDEFNDVFDFMNYYNPEGVFQDNWNQADIIYGKFCVDSDNNLYILDLDGDCVQKKSNRGVSSLSSDDIGENSYPINNSYAINIGPNGYIYFTQDTVTVGSPVYCINKINPNTLIIEDILYLHEGDEYYGLAVDSDGSIYIHNYSDRTIEKWNFKDGFTEFSLNLDYNYEFSELAIAGNYIGGIGKNGNAFKILKTSTETEAPFTLTDIHNLLYISSIGEDLLFCGLNESNGIVFERYNIIQESIEWSIFIIDNVYSDCIIGAYPF